MNVQGMSGTGMVGIRPILKGEKESSVRIGELLAMSRKEVEALIEEIDTLRTMIQVVCSDGEVLQEPVLNLGPVESRFGGEVAALYGRIQTAHYLIQNITKQIDL